jgi:hypothetical protein
MIVNRDLWRRRGSGPIGALENTVAACQCAQSSPRKKMRPIKPVSNDQVTYWHVAVARLHGGVIGSPFCIILREHRQSLWMRHFVSGLGTFPRHNAALSLYHSYT